MRLLPTTAPPYLLAALLLAHLLPAGLPLPVFGGGGGRLAAQLRSLAGLPADERASGEIRLAKALSHDGPGGIAAYAALASNRHKRTLLRLMSLSGNAAYLAVIHRELKRGPRRELRMAALTAAAAMGRPESAPFVGPYLGSAEAQPVVLALSYFAAQPGAVNGEDLAPLLPRRDPHVRAALLRLLALLGLPEFDAYCLEALRDMREVVRRAAVRCAAGANGGYGALTAAFPYSSAETQAAIIAALKTHHPARSAPLLQKWLNHPRRPVALAALIALQEMNAPGSAAALMAVIDAGASPLPPEVLLKSLGLFRDGRALHFLGKKLARAGSERRKIVLMGALGDLGMIEGQAYLLDYLSHPQPALRAAAREALQRIAARQPP